MISTIIRIFPHDHEKASIAGFLNSLLRPLCVQPGCLGCSVAIESDPDAIVLLETWESEADLQCRLQSDGYAKVLEALEMSQSKPEVRICEVIDQDGLEFIDKVRMMPES